MSHGACAATRRKRGSVREGDTDLGPAVAQWVLCQIRSISDLLDIQAPEALGCTKGITPVTIKSVYLNHNALTVLYVHVPSFKTSMVSGCPALEV